MYSLFRRPMEAFLKNVDRFFDRVYSSRFNPLYRSGPLAAGLLLIVLATGFYLIFFYKLSAPYASMQAIQDQVYFGRWIRTLHRYASDAAVIVVMFHVLRMLVEAKTWGPRVLAWVSGVILGGVMLFSGFTGYVLVWDRFGQEVALSGAGMLNVLPYFSETIMRGFSGANPVGMSFFFMNLFLHVALPLGMIVGLWIHTSRLSRAAWLPGKRTFWWLAAAFALVSIVWPAPLAGPPDLQSLGARVPTDWFFGFSLPLHWYGSPGLQLGSWILATLLPLTIPFWWRPKAAGAPGVARHEPAHCEGCEQCVKDCPYEAVDMTDRPGSTKPNDRIASVQANKCVGCGLCSASCATFAIGPEGLHGRDQLAKVHAFKATHPSGGTILMTCSHSSLGTDLARTFRDDVILWPVPCTGIQHASVTAFLLKHFSGLYVLGCPPGHCKNRTGDVLFMARTLQGQNPELPASADRRKFQYASWSLGERDQAVVDLRAFLNRVRGTDSQSIHSSAVLGAGRKLAIAAVTVGFIFAIAWITRLEGGKPTDHSALRVALRIPGQGQETCRELTPTELNALPAHMRRDKLCTKAAYSYGLKVFQDGTPLVDRTVHPKGARADRPVFIEQDIPISVGTHKISVQVNPIGTDDAQALRWNYDFEGQFIPGRAILLTRDPASGQLVAIP